MAPVAAQPSSITMLATPRARRALRVDIIRRSVFPPAGGTNAATIPGRLF